MRPGPVDLDGASTRRDVRRRRPGDARAGRPAQDLASAVEGLLDDFEGRAPMARCAAGSTWHAGRTWDAAAEQVEAGLRAAIAHAHRDRGAV